jgi:hypothetical protein
MTTAKNRKRLLSEEALLSPLLMGGAGIAALAAVALAAPSFLPLSYDAAGPGASAQEAGGEKTAVPSVAHLATPEPMHAIYMSQCVAGTPSFRDELVALIDETSLNAVVVDVKDYSGTIGFPAEDPRFADAAMQTCGASDMKAFIERLHEKGIYVIARITVFQDPLYSKRHPDQAVQSLARPGEPWKDHKGLSFVDVSSRDYWDYIVVLSKEAYALGFDELNYDYIRYPSDGPMKDAVYQNPYKAAALETFFEYLHQEVKPTGAVMSADLFGYTTVLTDDLGIGQILERALPYFDYIAPMVYPSHYNKGFEGLANPNSDPYQVVYASMEEAVRRTVATTTTVAAFAHSEISSTSPQLYEKPAYSPLKLRPWLQDFDYGKDYLPADITAQMQAAYDAGLTSWYFWDPANKYSSLRQVLRPQ